MFNIQSVRSKVAQIYYTHGLFCASHPFPIITVVICTIIITCYPLSTLPLASNTPLQHRTPREGFSVPPETFPNPAAKNRTLEDLKRPRWYVGPPVAYIQQLVVRAAVSPWQHQDMIPSDAYRSPLASVFNIIHMLEGMKVGLGPHEQSTSDVCYRVSEPVNAAHLKELLPQYDCLILSPANLWKGDIERYKKDDELIKTIYRQHGNIVESAPTSRDLLFGIPWNFSGISRYFIRNQQRVITYAVTVILKKYDPKFLSALQDQLSSQFPHTNTSLEPDIVHVHFKDSNYLVEYTPFMVTYLVLLLYLYFSVRKIDLVKSKIGLAISAVVTVVASLLMSVSMCTLFGLTPTLNSGEIFPYLVIIIGMENVLVITKSVVSTPVHLDVKIRVAQGLSKEGWYITKNLVTELAVMFVGYFTFVPEIQEFCTFALVGVLTDFYLQMAFFATILSVDIRRLELTDLHKQSVQQAVHEDDYSPVATMALQPLVTCPFASRPSPHRPPITPSLTPDPSVTPRTQLTPSHSSHVRSHSFHSLQGMSALGPQSPSTQPSGQDRPRYEMPRRVKFFYFVARFRIVQRVIMVSTVAWIVLILYKAGLFSAMDQAGRRHPEEGQWLREDALGGSPVEHTHLEMWKLLPHKHWPGLFHYYNVSLSGKYISVLPSLRFSQVIPPTVAMAMRHLSDQRSVNTANLSHGSQDLLYPGAQGAYHEDMHPEMADSSPDPMWGSPAHPYAFYPKSHKEFVITITLCVLSVVVLTYFLVHLYRCMCSRNYSRWRHSWTRTRSRRRKEYVQQIKETRPLDLIGHSQNIECLLGDNGLIVSCCLGGHLKIWNSSSGDCINTITRRSITPPAKRRPCVGRNIEDSDADLYAEYHGSRSPSETSLVDGDLGDGSWIGPSPNRGPRHTSNADLSDLRPDLTTTINTEFSSLDSPTKGHDASPSGYDFKSLFEGVYEEHRRYVQGSDLRGAHSSSDLYDLGSPVLGRNRTWSYGDPGSLDASAEDEGEQSSPVWCLACLHGLVVTGCGNGRIEVWEGETGQLRYCYGASHVPVTGLCVVSNKIVAARIDGTLDFLEMETFHSPTLPHLTPHMTSQQGPPFKGHSRSKSSSTLDGLKTWDEVIRCAGVTTVRAHQLPINIVQCAGGRIVTASQDHTLKVFRLDNSLCLYTLHGHEDSVTALCLDQIAPLAAVSGSQDGSVRMWDLLTGTCLHKLAWHTRTVVTLSTSPLYIVSVGLDDRMCVWDRTRSCLMHTIHLDQGGVGSAALLSRSLMVTGGQGNICLWDIPKGCLVRRVTFPDSEQFINHIHTVGNNGVVCDQGSELKVVYFPTILEKAE